MLPVSIPANSTPGARGFVTTLRAGLNAGLMNGMLFGLADGIIAGLSTKPDGVFAWLGCLGLSVLTYGLVWIGVLMLASPILHALLRTKDLYGRFRVLLILAFGLGLFLELYWWTRPYLLSGHAALDPRRLALAALFLALGMGLSLACGRLLRRLPGAVPMTATIAVPLLWIVGGAYLLSTHSATVGRGDLNARNRELPNVLLIVCDALRSDVIGAYGNTRVKTPVIDELAKNGVLFENTIVTAPFTWASFGSILTGKYPRRHGLVKMDPRHRMGGDNVTLPWQLKSAKRLGDGVKLEDRDFISATFMTGTLSHGSGLARGFDIYYEALVGHDIVDTASAWSIFRSQLVLSILRDKLAQSFDSSRVVSVARKWFGEQSGQRFMVMVHLYSTHTPYDPPKKFREMYCDPKYSGPVTAFYAEHRLMIESGEAKPTDADMEQIRNLYYAGVSQADFMIGELLAQLRASGALDNTLVMLTADHGEELGDHHLWEHNWPFQTNQSVPLVMALPGKLPAGRRVGAGVQSIDIFPTILELLGLDLPEAAKGTDPLGQIDGKSLMPLIRSEVKTLRPFAFCENEVFLSVQDTAASGPRYKLIVAANQDCGQSLKAQSGDGLRPMLFRLDVDPTEKDNLLEREPAQAQRLLDALCEWDTSLPIRQQDVLESDRDTVDLELLQLLGYADNPHPPKKPGTVDKGQGAARPVDRDH